MHLSLLSLSQTPTTPCKPSSFNWTTTKSTSVNLGGWLFQESTIDNTFWTSHAPIASDEWTLCKTLGDACGPILEHRYRTFIARADIDTLASVGLYSGNQRTYLRRITEYATSRYGMHVTIDVHSLSGGLNGLMTGEATGHWGWFFNETAWAHSMEVVDEVLEFIGGSSSPGSFTLEPMNEPADRNGDDDLGMAVFGTPEALSDDAASYVLSFWQAVLARVTESGLDVAVMFQSFKLPDIGLAELPDFIRSDAQNKSGDVTFPVFVGEWSIQAAYNNSFALKERNLKFGLEAWEEYMQGLCYWTANQRDYWSFERFIEEGFLL
ncbi:glycoside hydrolase superfamily [Aspergillus keveii]|uniref:glucan 1,3-beta-glucosidase n=1 Tax=Aspergillus keveii TaxID=714993 RepID=A0ABR4G5B1_9EURO